MAESNHARRRARDHNRKRTYLMPKKREKQKTAESIQLLDVYESWLAKQPVKPVKGKPGFISAVEAEAAS